MWQTPVGERTLEGVERALFVLAVTQMYEELRYEEIPTLGQSESYPWATVNTRTKIIALAQVARAILDFDYSSPVLYAWNESTINSVVEYIKYQFDRDPNPWLEEGTQIDWKRLAQTVMRGTNFGCPTLDEKGTVWPASFEAWAQSRWLGTNAWRLCEIVMDLPPETSTRIKGTLGVANNYFSEPFPAATTGRYLGAVEMFEKLVAEVAVISQAYSTAF